MSGPVDILLSDLLHPGCQLKTFPYAAGCVGSYAAGVLGDRIRFEVFRDPVDLDSAFFSRQPALLGFSNYIWNLNLTYEVIRRAKAADPRVVIVLGGPNYPDQAARQCEFFRRYPLVDFYVFKEGELPFVGLLECLLRFGFDTARLKREQVRLAGVHYLSAGDLITAPVESRTRDLDRYPSPYLGGLLDKFFAHSELMPLIQTKRGCPFECTFCVEGADYYAKLASVSTSRFRAELEYIARRVVGQPRLHIADSNFGMYQHDLELCDVIAAVRAEYDWPGSIEVSTGKNKNERIVEAVRRTGGAMRFGPALQTTDPMTLRNIKRSNISGQALIEVATAASALDQRSYTELVLGLPGDSFDSHLESIRVAMDAGLQRIKMYPLILLPGTEMASDDSRQRFGLQTRFRPLPQCHGTYRFGGDSFPCAEVIEVVVGTNSMSPADYLRCRQFELSVEIFYGDRYLEELHGLAGYLGISMFEVVRHCHRNASDPGPLRGLHEAMERAQFDHVFDSRAACEQYYGVAANLADYARSEFRNSLATLKAMALIDHIETVITLAGEAILQCATAADRRPPWLPDYLTELVRYSILRRRGLLDGNSQHEGLFEFAFDQIMARRFAVDPLSFRLPQPRRMRFWHDERQRRDIHDLCATVTDSVLRARGFIYPASDPGTNPYLRQSAFC